MTQTVIVTPYVDYGFYTDVFHGSLISEEEFERYEARAEDAIDAMTWYRIPDMEEKFMTASLAMRIRKAVCAAADQYKDLDRYFEAKRAALESAVRSGGKASESNDGYSVSYTAGTLYGNAGYKSDSDARTAAEYNVKKVVAKYLADTALLYRGLGVWHDD